ncbi:MAG: CO dehydrogenase/CO-methylating acetyl-CoA synthase complex subunit beta, partial [Elusimicrobiota bacterium]|nr:CO dehydrogenase/CO-methylating acetyl-CoA synthase complex subunit beta [Elusimicrobiota bacterium]
MSKIVAAAAIRGANKIVKDAGEFLARAITEKGESQKIEFPDTAYYFPMAYALLGAEVKTLGDIKPVLAEAKSLLHTEPTENLWLPYLGDALDSGIATLLAEEIIVGLRYLYGQEPQPDCIGFFSDTILRQLGIQLVDGRMPGFAAILGAAPDNKTAVEIVREFQKRQILSFVGSSTNGRSIIDQLKEENVEMGWDNYIVPYGRDTITGIYPLNWAIRGALTFGGHKKGEALKCLKYCQNRVFAFGLTLGFVDNEKYATGAGAINMGFPIIADTDIPEILPTGICTYEHLVKELDHKKIVPRCIEVRGVKVKVSEIPIPVAYSAAFEGERVRKVQTYLEAGSKYSTAYEYVTTKNSDEITDGKIEIIGSEIDDIKEGSAVPLGIYVEVAGRKIQKEFESIIERQIHTFLNEAQGIMHTGQRDLVWLRISKEAKSKGFKLKHLGTIIHARIHEVFGTIVDKVQIKIYTKDEDVKKLLPEARESYKFRDDRMGAMTDESVDTFYSCTLCQSFAPNHLCIVKPERLGLCGAYNWLDC